MSREISQLAFVLHRRPYRETSFLVTFFTQQHGKVNAVVRGVRSNSKAAKLKQAWLQPFQALTIQWREKPDSQSDLVTLRNIEPSSIRVPLMGEASVCGLYLNELCYRLLYPSLMSEQLFDHYRQTLFDLAKASDRNSQAWYLRQFEYQLLAEMGYGVDFSSDSHQQPLVPEQSYVLHAESGWIPESEAFFDAGVKVRGECLIKFVEQQYSEDCLTSLKHLFRFLLAPYLGEKPIQARALFQGSVKQNNISEGQKKT